ncbi:MAG TPA: alpha-1,2-fucosyltransferase, partial [Methylotenera sp.]|nr:alpha-1,2-fucosyltransferase [Methylotenera sp.]
EQIRKDFTFKLALSVKNSAIIEQISQVNAVSLHVRRGDYVTNAKNAFIGVCSLEYYRKAVEYVKNQVDKPVFFVFSDDIEWVKSNLPIDFPCFYIDHNHGIESFNDMRLMSHCKHHIIANSSFSWWGAWLNANSEKIVIAPQQWFANNTNVNDLLPESWIKL